MSAEEIRHIALPRLVGAPAYARPTVQVARVERPFDRDDLPLEAVMTDEERALLAHGPSSSQSTVADDHDGGAATRSFSLRALADRFRSGRD